MCYVLLLSLFLPMSNPSPITQTHFQISEEGLLQSLSPKKWSCVRTKFYFFFLFKCGNFFLSQNYQFFPNFNTFILKISFFFFHFWLLFAIFLFVLVKWVTSNCSKITKNDKIKLVFLNSKSVKKI